MSSSSSSSYSSSDDDDDNNSLNNNPYRLPISEKCILFGHNKSITSLALDKSGSRLLSGSMDYKIKMWDFNGMRSDLKSFRELEPTEGYPINSLQYNKNGDIFLCCTGDSQPKLYDRDGIQKAVFIRGDMYLLAMKNTKGHITSTTDCFWHPNDKNICITSAADKTIRKWDVNYPEKNLRVAIFHSSIPRLNVTCCTISPNGKIIAGAAIDGTIQLFDENCRNGKIIKNAHLRNTETGGLCFSRNNYTLLSRGGDDTVKVWDIRHLSKNIETFNIPNSSCHCNITFNPTEQVFVTGYSVIDDEKQGGIVFFDRRDMKEYRRVPIATSNMHNIIFHPTLNQIIVGSSNGATYVLYDRQLSQKGALLCVDRQVRKLDVSDLIEYHNVDNPNGIKSKKNLKRARNELSKRNMPTVPPTDLGSGGRLGSSWQAHVMKPFVQKQFRDQDSREEILKRAKIAAENPRFIGDAYQHTQPVPIFANVNNNEDNDNDDDEKNSAAKK